MNVIIAFFHRVTSDLFKRKGTENDLSDEEKIEALMEERDSWR
jgi:hypothetical protein